MYYCTRSVGATKVGGDVELLPPVIAVVVGEGGGVDEEGEAGD